MGGTFDKPKTLEELADKVQQNFDSLARSLPNTDLSQAGVLGTVGLRVVAGYVDATGAGTGSGFTSAKIGTGTYSLTFPSGTFTARPAVVAMSGHGGAATGVKGYSGTPSATYVDLVVFDAATGAAADNDFYFVAIGAR